VKEVGLRGRERKGLCYAVLWLGQRKGCRWGINLEVGALSELKYLVGMLFI
jgi:hypothetical protein